MIKLNKSDRYWLDFVLAMTQKEIKARYKHALLGFLWVLLNPLIQMVSIGLIFQFMVPVKVDNYFLFLFAGLLPWNFFSLSTTKNAPIIINERSLIQKANFPREAIVLSVILSNLFHFMISLVMLMVLLLADKIFFEHYGLTQLVGYVARFGLIVPIVLWLVLFVSGVSLFFAALNVKYRDVNFIVQALIPVWFYATPIVYSVGLLPKELRVLLYLNPMTGITESFHYALLSLKPYSIDLLLLGLAVSLMVFFIGWKVFERESKFFDDWV